MVNIVVQLMLKILEKCAVRAIYIICGTKLGENGSSENQEMSWRFAGRKYDLHQRTVLD